MEFLLIGVVGDIQDSDNSNTVILEMGDRPKCLSFFSDMSEDEKQAFVEIFVMEKDRFTALADKTLR